jgi:hypothetical protein
MITGNNKKGKQETDKDVMHIPWNFSYRGKTGTKKEYPTSDDYSTWNASQIRKECTARKLNMKSTSKREERVELKFLKGKLTKVKKDMYEEEE